MNYWNKEIECAPRSEIEALQSYRLSRTIRRVYENVAPYRKKMDEAGVRPEDIKSVADLSKPLTYALTILGIDTNLQFIFEGIIILAAVTLDCLKYVQKK